MNNEEHLSDRDLILWLDGELSRRRSAQAEGHLKSCWSCRVRRQELEQAITGFVHAYRGGGPDIPTPDGPRAKLRSELAQAGRSVRPRIPQLTRLALGALATALLALLVMTRFPSKPRETQALVLPNRSLTPGAAVFSDTREICSESQPNNKDVPPPLRNRVFETYGLRNVEAKAYEVDYLITPALGGADDIRNLWPHSYAQSAWNAKVKDALEDRLHTMVCDGQVDLATAQRELATDWIQAYKKYFHTNQPVQEN